MGILDPRFFSLKNQIYHLVCKRKLIWQRSSEVTDTFYTICHLRRQNMVSTTTISQAEELQTQTPNTNTKAEEEDIFVWRQLHNMVFIISLSWKEAHCPGQFNYTNTNTKLIIQTQTPNTNKKYKWYFLHNLSTLGNVAEAKYGQHRLIGRRIYYNWYLN